MEGKGNVNHSICSSWHGLLEPWFFEVLDEMIYHLQDTYAQLIAGEIVIQDHHRKKILNLMPNLFHSCYIFDSFCNYILVPGKIYSSLGQKESLIPKFN